ncbi:peptidase domain-containing ABC transporter [Flavipsychrobacter stenotrophus]|nr:ABC transporter ATP-binding protein [Flavipsychrobacter stenotrophus]
MAEKRMSTLLKLLEVLKFEKSEISSIYFYAIIAGVVQLSLPLGIQSIISFVLGGTISTSMVLLIALVIIGVLVAGLLQVNQMKLIEKIQQQLFVRYAFKYADTIPKLNLQDVDNYYLPELVNRFFDTVSLQKGISKILLDIPAASIQIIFGLILLSFYHPVFIFFGLLLLVVLYLILITTGNKGLQTSMEESNYKYKVAGYLQEIARVITTFKFSRNSSLHINKTDDYVSGYLQSRTSHFKILLFQYWTLIVFKLLIISAMLIVGAILLVDQQINVGQFIASEIVILMIIGSVEKMIVSLDNIYDVLTSVEKINKLLEKPKEKVGSQQLIHANAGFSLEVKDVSFGYSSEKLILKDLSFNIPAGSRVCVMGANSAGKSTLIRLLSGAYQDFEGTILINNIPISNYDIRSIRGNIGVLLSIQEIFQGTIKENICIGNDAISYEQMNYLAEITGLKQFVDSHKEGYDFEIKPIGNHLPDKIVKKVLLVRALIHNPQMLLLEEPWLGLEEQYVKQIQAHILQKLTGKTIIVVTNDVAFADQCNLVIEMERGAVKSIKTNNL